jgi:hypothetical protein
MDLRRSMLSPQAKGSERGLFLVLKGKLTNYDTSRLQWSVPALGLLGRKERPGLYGRRYVHTCTYIQYINSKQTCYDQQVGSFTGQLLVLHPPEYYFTYYSTPLAARPPRSARGRDPPTRRPAHPPLSKVKVIFHLYMILLCTCRQWQQLQHNSNSRQRQQQQHRQQRQQ